MSRSVIACLLFVQLVSAGNLYHRNSCKHYIEYSLAPVSPQCYNDPNVQSDLAAMVTRGGYPVELHEIVTKDKYILSLYRIPNPGKPPIFFQHGIATNPNHWIDKGNRSHALLAYDKGYDVWLGSVRGTTYARKHETLSTNDRKFWNYNLDHLALYDVAAMLDYVSQETSSAGKIIYVGHSMGTTLSYMFAAEHPDKAEQMLQGIISMSPVVYLDKMVLIRLISPFVGTLRSALSLLGVRVFLNHDTAVRSVFQTVCRVVPLVCGAIVKYGSGIDPNQIRAEELLLYYTSWPVSMSVDQLVQYGQISGAARFQKFDYGTSKNKEKYGIERPPAYDLSKVTVPVVLFHGPRDILCPYENVLKLYNDLGSKDKKMIQMSQDGKVPFQHINFLYAKDLPTILFPSLFENIDRIAQL